MTEIILHLSSGQGPKECGRTPLSDSERLRL